MKENFPILNKQINDQPLVYFDNAATTQKPRVVIEAMNNFYKVSNANVHRSINPLAEQATALYEEARKKVKNFIKATSTQEIIFTSGTTASINLVAQSWGRANLKLGDRVVLTISEHHSNLVPWLQLKKEIGIAIDYISLDDNFNLDYKQAEELLNNDKVKLLAITHTSNVLGQINNIEKLIKIAKAKNIATLVDAAQVVAHLPIDVQKLNCDWLVFSGHKMYGPTGIGILYGKQEILSNMPAWQGGGEMIHEVFKDDFTDNELPYKFEAGTPNIAGAIGLGVAIDFINEVSFVEIARQEEKLTSYFLDKIKELDFVKPIGSIEVKNRLPVFSFSISGVHPHDAGDILGEEGIIMRAGHHCAQPLHDGLGIPATLRASLAFYNTTEEIDKLMKEMQNIYQKFN